VRSPLAAYLLHLRSVGRRSTGRDAAGTIRLVVDKQFGFMRLEELTRDDVEAWRARHKAGRAPRSLIRCVRKVVAALNCTVDNCKHAGNRDAWDPTHLRDDDEHESAVFLSPLQRDRLIAAAPSASGITKARAPNCASAPSPQAATASPSSRRKPMEICQRALDCAGGRHALAPGRLVPCDSRDSSVFADDAQVMQRITNLAHEMNVHIMIIAHAGKRKADDDPMKVIAGTNELTASVDDVFVWFTMMESENILVRDETKRRIVALLGGGAAMTRPNWPHRSDATAPMFPMFIGRSIASWPQSSCSGSTAASIRRKPEPPNADSTQRRAPMSDFVVTSVVACAVVFVVGNSGRFDLLGTHSTPNVPVAFASRRLI
jgi:hypothetical protein